MKIIIIIVSQIKRKTINKVKFVINNDFIYEIDYHRYCK